MALFGDRLNLDAFIINSGLPTRAALDGRIIDAKVGSKESGSSDPCKVLGNCPVLALFCASGDVF